MNTSISTESRAQLARVARGGALNLVGALVAAIAGFALVVVVARAFSPTTAGVLFASTSVFLVVVSLAVFGADTGLIQFILRFEEGGRSADIPTVLRSARRPVLVTSVAIAAAVLLFAGPLSDLLGLDHPRSPAVLRVLGVTVPFAAMAQLALSETRALSRMRPTVLIDNLFRATAQTIAAVIVGLLGGGLLMLSVGWALPYVMSAALAIPTARWYLRRQSRRWAEVGAADPAEVRREFRHYTWPRGVARVSQIVVQRADIIIIAAMLGAAPAAIYTAATRFVVVGQMSAQAISNVLMPRLAQLLPRRDMVVVSDVFKISTAWSMAVAWPLYAVIASSASLYLEVFGERYVGNDGVPVVVTMSVAMMITTAAGALDSVLLMSGRSMASLVNGLVAASLNVALCLVLIPWIGIVGAAIAWAVAVLVRNLLAFILVRHDLGLTPLSPAAALVAVAVIGCYVVPLVALSVLGLLTVSGFAVAVFVGTMVYAAIIWRGRATLELRVFRSVLPKWLARRLDEDAAAA